MSTDWDLTEQYLWKIMKEHDLSALDGRLAPDVGLITRYWNVQRLGVKEPSRRTWNIFGASHGMDREGLWAVDVHTLHAVIVELRQDVRAAETDAPARHRLEVLALQERLARSEQYRKAYRALVLMAAILWLARIFS